MGGASAPFATTHSGSSDVRLGLQTRVPQGSLNHEGLAMEPPST